MNREELLRSARNLYENPGTNEALKVVLEETYPELKEREDEKIRKYIIKFIKLEKGVNLPPEDADKMLAYLEKQKEQNPIFRVGDYVRNIKTGDKVLIEQLDIATKIYCYVSNDGVAEIHSDFPFSKQNEWEVIGQQIEQKPAEWSEEDNEKIKRLRSIVNDCAFRNDALDVNGDYCEGDYEELDNWLTSLRPLPHWKPSEEQMEALGYAIEGKFDAIKPTSYLSRRLEELEAGLKTLL